MRLLTIGSLSLACLFTVACKDDSDSRRLLPFGVATIGASLVDFDGSTHAYDAGFDASGILLDSSDPPDWQLVITWQGDVDPGITDTQSGISVLVENPLGTLYVAGPTTASVVTLETSRFATSPGKRTAGTFWGEVENLTDPLDVLTVVDGEFRAVRIP